MSWEIALLGAGAALLGSIVGGLFAWRGTNRQLAHDERMRIREARITLADELLSHVLTMQESIQEAAGTAFYALETQIPRQALPRKRYTEDSDVMRLFNKIFSLSAQIGDAKLSSAYKEFYSAFFRAMGGVFALSLEEQKDDASARAKTVEAIDNLNDLEKALNAAVEQLAREVGRIKGLIVE